jgi:hypothetical protein
MGRSVKCSSVGYTNIQHLDGIGPSKVAFRILNMFSKGFNSLDHFVANLLSIILGKFSKYD